MLLRRFFERTRTRSSTETNKRENHDYFTIFPPLHHNQVRLFLLLFIHLEICLCTTAKRDSLYDGATVFPTKTTERSSADQHVLVRTGKTMIYRKKFLLANHLYLECFICVMIDIDHFRLFL